MVKPPYLRGNADRALLLNYTLAFALQLRKNHWEVSVRVAEKCQLVAEKCQLSTICLVDWAAVTAATDCVTINTLGLRFGWVRLTLGQRKCLPSCQTKGFPASDNYESKLSVRALMWSAKNEIPKSS